MVLQGCLEEQEAPWVGLRDHAAWRMAVGGRRQRKVAGLGCLEVEEEAQEAMEVGRLLVVEWMGRALVMAAAQAVYEVLVRVLAGRVAAGVAEKDAAGGETADVQKGTMEESLAVLVGEVARAVVVVAVGVWGTVLGTGVGKMEAEGSAEKESMVVGLLVYLVGADLMVVEILVYSVVTAAMLVTDQELLVAMQSVVSVAGWAVQTLREVRPPLRPTRAQQGMIAAPR